MRLFSFSIGFLLATQVFAGPFSPNAHKIERRVRIASDVLYDRQHSSYFIPEWVYQNAQCIASLRVVKAGFVWGGEGSTGLVSCKVNDEWSAPSFLNVGGVNFGFQIGVQFFDSILVFVTRDARRVLEGPSVKLGADIGFAAGPVGGGFGGGVIPKAPVLTYDRATGLYAGATVNGFVLAHGKERNQFVYGNGVRPYQILRTPGRFAPVQMRPFVETLESYFPTR